jgi:hypothetical protein
MLTLRTDVYITRRMRSHFIVDNDEFVRFSAPQLADCLEWLVENDQLQFRVEAGVNAYEAQISRKVT